MINLFSQIIQSARKAPGVSLPPVAAERASANLLTVGHSLLSPTQNHMLEVFLDHSEKSDSSINYQTIVGASLQWNWNNGASAQGINARTYLEATDPPSSPVIDVFIATPQLPIATSNEFNSIETYYGNYFKLARARNASAEGFLFQTWPEIDAGDYAAWSTEITSDQSIWESILGRINAETDVDGITMIPGGSFLQYVRNNSETFAIGDLFSDNIHLSNLGMWLTGLFIFSWIYNLTPSGYPFAFNDVWGSPYTGMPTESQRNEMETLIASYIATI